MLLKSKNKIVLIKHQSHSLNQFVYYSVCVGWFVCYVCIKDLFSFSCLAHPGQIKVTSPFPLHILTSQFCLCFCPCLVPFSSSLCLPPLLVHSLTHTPRIPRVTVMASDGSEHDDKASSHPPCRRGNPYEINIMHTSLTDTSTFNPHTAVRRKT